MTALHTLAAADEPTIDLASTGFVIICASLVLLMTVPGLALFYGGMNRAKSVLNMMMMSFGAAGLVGVLYVLFGYSMSFGPSDIGGIFANPFDKLGLKDTADLVNPFGYEGYGNIPELAFVGFQLTFAIITVALISGAIADRVKFSTWLVFSGLWVTLAYFPIAHMVWGGGLLSASESGLSARIFGSTDGAADVVPIDFAGGTVVHINAGMAGLVLALIVGKRLGFGKTIMRPHNVPLVMIGAGLLWFGWFGFNAGSELAPDETAAMVWVNTVVATCAAMLGWLLVEKIRDGHGTSIGAASGVVAGLVAITPACGALSPIGSIILGLIAGGLCALAVGLKYRFGYDDSLDVVGVHLVAGLWGTIGAGLLSTATGLFYGGGVQQTVVQIVIALASLLICGIVTAALGFALKATMGWRINEDDETAGIDQSEHAETAYDLSPRGGRMAGALGLGSHAREEAPIAEGANA
ncbi:ammonium transporter [Nostocoides australiense Ben110]|uniref:Ammonium transporter n=1 Tax=Nostocoides australiense Ben110 TaxID=1193182 RepID=W6JTP7_9MICO|nr:ammonium transporter [Tetrasphaera australiensis]MCA0290367.1 ammonium transporter [Actinomycetota bacterium]CCH71851.1 ammonium transporter [Tetrasphaera australiensis Ben110]